ncbi:hypothetical protein D9M73_173700 [compost metagenome]
MLVDKTQRFAKDPVVHVVFSFHGAQRRAQQADNRLQGGFAFLQAEVLLMGRLHDQALGQHRRRRRRGNALATLDAGETQAAFDQLTRQDQRQLARRIAVDEIARQGRVDQGDIARQQLNAVAGLLHEGAPAELKGRVIVRAFITRQLAFGAVQARLGNIHHAQFDRACA